jgi:hypothetical protein
VPPGMTSFRDKGMLEKELRDRPSGAVLASSRAGRDKNPTLPGKRSLQDGGIMPTDGGPWGRGLFQALRTSSKAWSDPSASARINQWTTAPFSGSSPFSSAASGSIEIN